MVDLYTDLILCSLNVEASEYDEGLILPKNRVLSHCAIVNYFIKSSVNKHTEGFS